MNLCDVCSLIIAPARTGKTYYVAEWIAKTLLPKTKKTVWTNCPIKIKEMAEYVEKNYGLPAEETEKRIHIIDRETETNWKNEGKVYFRKNPPALPFSPMGFPRPFGRGPGMPRMMPAPYAGSRIVESKDEPEPSAEPTEEHGEEAPEEPAPPESKPTADPRDEHERRVLTEEQARLLKPDGGSYDPFVYDGPWLYFWGRDADLDGAIIILDEVHNFCGATHCKEVQDRWSKFIAELGHKKAMLRCISQNFMAIGPGIRLQQASRYCIENTSLRRIPFFKIQLYEIQMLLKAFLGIPYFQPIVLEEQRTDVFNNRKVNVENTFATTMRQEIFNLYDSFNKPIEGSQEIDPNKKPFRDKCDEYLDEYGKTKGRFFLLLDFILAHFFRLAIGVPILILLCLSPFYYSTVIGWTSDWAKSFAQKFGKVKEAPKQTKIELPPERPIVDTPLQTAKAEMSIMSITPSRYTEDNVIKRQVIAPKLCAIAPDFLAFDDGLIVNIGDEFLDSTLEKIDFKTKKAYLKNGKKINIVFSNFADDASSTASHKLQQPKTGTIPKVR